FLVLAILNNIFHEKKTGLVLIFIFLFLVLFCIKNFKDIRDRPKDSSTQDPSFAKTIFYPLGLIFREIRAVGNELKQERTRKALSSFLLWQISFYCVNALDVDLRVEQFSGLTTAMMAGYLLGVVILRFLYNVDDFKMVRIGY